MLHVQQMQNKPAKIEVQEFIPEDQISWGSYMERYNQRHTESSQLQKPAYWKYIVFFFLAVIATYLMILV